MNELKTYLRINSVFSMLSGITAIYFSDWLFDFFNLNNNGYLIDLIGFNLIVFSCFVWLVSSKKTTNKVLVNLIVLLDVTWVLGSMLIVVFQLFNLSMNGYLLITAIAIFIGFLAYKQWRGLRSIVNNVGASPRDI